jgi:hypothetical protein
MEPAILFPLKEFALRGVCDVIPGAGNHSPGPFHSKILNGDDEVLPDPIGNAFFLLGIQKTG